MSNWLVAPNHADNRLAVVRIDATGSVVFEDARQCERRRVDAEAAMRAVLETPKSEGSGLRDITSDWIEKGWRPSLEYFLWSEQSAESAGSTPLEGSGSATTEARPSDWISQPLPIPTPGPTELTVGELLMKRRTVRTFAKRSLLAADLAGVIALPGVELGAGVALRLVSYDVAEFPAGIWSIDPKRAAVRLEVSGDFRKEMCALMCGMPAAKTAAITLVLVVDMCVRQQTYPYERALRELYVDLGRIGQRLIIAAEMLDLGCLITPATNDRELSSLLRLEERECPLYTITIGHKRQRGDRLVHDGSRPPRL